MTELGKTFVGLGLLLIVLGGAMLLASRFGLPFGRLPGDLDWRSRGGSTQVYFPLATCIVLSLLFSLILWLLRSFRR
jgi:ribose/xylose/arabinose/galactoside ABC-type transport system permease subunit